MDDLRKGCPMRHENGNCTVIGGFCTAVNDPICDGLHNAYDSGYRAAAIHVRQERENPEQITNADRIRAMSDEELAVWLVKKTVYQESAFSRPSYLNFLTELDDTKESAIKGTVEWLQQPAEGE